MVLTEFNRLNLDLRCVKAIASVDLKKDEQGLLAFAQKYNLPAHFYTADELNSVAGEFTQSAFVKSVVGVSNVCERSAVIDSANGKLLLKKTSLNGVTLAIASDCNKCKGYVWFVSGDWHHDSYRITGHLKYCRCNKFHAKHWCDASVYQLWWYVDYVFDCRNGCCAECVKRCTCGNIKG